MRHVGLFATRVIFGGYLAAHGAQKLFGSFGGPGLATTATGFEGLGMRPGRAMATLAGASELGGGLLTATGVADPLGPLAIAGTMAVATAVHRKQGPLSANGGYELPLTNLALAVGLLSWGPGRMRLGPRLPKPLAQTSAVVGMAIAAGALAQLLRATPPAPPAGGDDSAT